MYGGSTPNPVVPAVLGVGAGAVLPRTGMNSAVQVALAIAVGLAVWAVVYVAMSKFAKR